MHIWDVLDRDLYVKMLEEKFIRVQRHPSLPLCIVNYTEQAQFRQEWNDVTLNCRGLIFNHQTGEVVARGFKKFFNYDDSSQQYPPHGPVLRSPKMDGSLGILYPDFSDNPHGPLWAVATRGSFASDQAQWATNFLLNAHDNQSVDLDDLNPSKSYLVEIIYPDNRIVVNYDGWEALVLLDVLDTATGKADLEEFDRVFWLDKVERTYIPQGFSDAFVHDIPEGEEGFVVYWPERDYRVKMKAAEYLALHKMIFSLSERSVWERLGNGETVEEICVQLPDEFHSWVNDVAKRLFTEQAKIKADAFQQFKAFKDHAGDDRAVFARDVMPMPLRPYLFMLYDGKDIGDAIWKTLRPEGNKGIQTTSEDVA